VSTENGNKPKLRQIVISKLRAGEQPFLAWGYSLLKVTQLVQDPADPENFIPEEVEVKVPIKSIGVAEVTERISRKAPIPPIRKEYIRPGSEDAKALGLNSPRLVEVENFADPDYKEKLRNYNQESIYKMILAGLAMDIETADGVTVVQSNDIRSATTVIDEDKAVMVLKGQGLSNEHFDQLYSDIKALTSKEKARVDQE